MPGEGEQDNKVQGPLKPYFSAGGEKSPASYANTDVAVGTEVGPFKLLGILGEGGYGIVYLGEQERPIRRRVALKIIKPGMDSKQVIARFEAERQALAFLDHPNIAQIHDAGTTPQGRPYFAMELIEGRPITEHCDRERLSLSERLRLFLQVCSAIRHAHQKGILHRDLKPSNVLVATQDGEPLVKVIDFGIAKALAQPLTDRSLHTEQGQFIGTPDYMSPEQAEMDTRGVDTRSDVYSLGVILYELLTGMLPFDPDTLRNGGPQNVRRTIRQQEPKTPSTRLTALGEGIAGIAERRRTDPQTLARSLRRELEWIPLKAMRKDPSRRYQSVSELANDIENYLNELPLEAGPESTVYRTAKFVRRHRIPVATATTIILLLLAGIIITQRLYVTAERSRQIAEAARMAETSHRLAAEQERDRAMRAEIDAQGQLAGVYEQQARRFARAGDLDRALIFLSQAHALAPDRLGVHLLLFECLRKHSDPGLSSGPYMVGWQDGSGAVDMPFAISPDRMLIAFLDADRRLVRVFDTASGREKTRFEHPGIERLAFLPGNQYLVVKTQVDQSRCLIEVLDMAGNTIAVRSRGNIEPTEIHRLAENLSLDAAQMEQAYTRILISPNGDWFAFIDATIVGNDVATEIVMWDVEARMWHVAQGEQATQMAVGIGRLSPRAYAEGSIGKLLTVDKNGWIQRWRLPDCAFADSFPWPLIHGRCGPLGTRGLFVEKGPTAVLMTRRDNSTVRSFPGVSRLGFSPDGARLITARPLSTAENDIGESICGDLWDTLDGRHIAEIAGALLTNWHFSPDGRHLVTEHTDGSIHVVMPATGAALFAIPGEQEQHVADLSINGKWLLTRTSSDSQTAFLWDLATGLSYEVFDGESPMADLTAGWLCEEIDTVFAFSHKAPDRLPRFGPSSGWVIGSSGLWPCESGDDMLRDVDRLVKGYVPLRLDRGVIRSASQAELLEAKVGFHQLRKGPDAEETLDCLFDLTDLLIASGELDKAAGTLRPTMAYALTDRPGPQARRRQLMQTIAVGYCARANQNRRQNRHAAAVADCECSLEFQETPDSLNALAWLLITSPQVRDAARALSLARRGCETTEWNDWRLLTSYAAACAELGAFAEATRFQERALTLLSSESQARWKDNLEARLALFRSGTPYESNLECVFPGEDLVGWWTFDNDDGGIVLDSASHGQHGPLAKNARLLHDRHGGVLELTGEAGFVRCPRDPALDVTDAITVAAWVKDERLASSEDRSLIGVWNTWRLFLAGRSNAPGFEYLGVGARDSQPVTRVVASASIADGAWHHVAAVYDQDSVRVYVDGEPAGCAAASAAMGTGVEGIAFGEEKLQESEDTDVCLLDDVRVYHIALQQESIRALYRTGERTMTDRRFVNADGSAAH